MSTTPARRLRRLLAVSAVVALASVPAVAAQAKGKGNSSGKQTICHATHSNKNPYVINTPNKNGDVSGHAKHTGPIWNPTLKQQHMKWGDIIPPFDYTSHGATAHFAGLNWDANGQAWFANSCRVPITAAVVKTNDANGDGTFTKDETATSAGADVTFQVVVTNTSLVDEVVTGVSDAVAGSQLAITATPDPVGTTLAPGQSTTFTFTIAGASPADGQSVIDTVTVLLARAGDPSNQGLAQDTSTVRTVVPPPDISVVKTGPATVAPGGTLTWTLTVHNDGTVPAPGVTLTDTLPSGTTLVSADGTGWTCTGTTDLSCVLGSDLAVGDSSAVTVVATLDAAFTGATVANTAVVTPTDATPADNTSTATTTVVTGGGGGGGVITPPITGGGGSITLPRTGMPLANLVALGLALAVGGAGLTTLGRRTSTAS